MSDPDELPWLDTWLRDISGYVRAHLANDQEFTHLPEEARSLPLRWLDALVDDRAVLDALVAWEYVVDFGARSPGMRVVGRGADLDAAVRRLLRRSDVDRGAELAPGELARRSGADLGASLVVRSDSVDANWLVVGGLDPVSLTDRPGSPSAWRTVTGWAARVGASAVAWSVAPNPGSAVSRLSLELGGHDAKERLLDVLELYGALGIDRPRDDVLAAFMNHDLGRVGLDVACATVGVVEIGLTGTRADVETLVLLLDDLGEETVEHAARVQGILGSEPASIAAIRNTSGDTVIARYDLRAAPVPSSDDR